MKKKRISFEIERLYNETWIVHYMEGGVCTLAPREMTLLDALARVDDLLEKGGYTSQKKVKVDIIFRRS